MAYEIDCETCPFKKEGCNGITCFGNNPIYPPCSELEEDETIEEKYETYVIQKAAEEEYRKRIYEIEMEKKHKASLAKNRRLFMKRACRNELSTVASLKKQIESLQYLLDRINVYAYTVNVTNQLFGYEQRIKKDESFEKKLNELNFKLEKASMELKIKQKEVRKSSEYKSIKWDSKIR